MGLYSVGDETKRGSGRLIGIRARMMKGSQDGVWIELQSPYPMIEFRFTRGDEVVEQAAGHEVESYGEQYELVGPGEGGVYYYVAMQWRPKEKGAHVVSTRNIGKVAATPRKVEGRN